MTTKTKTSKQTKKKVVKKVAVVKKKVVSTTKISIYNNGEFIREYSLENHGKDFERLADQFVNKTGYEKRA